MKLTKREARVRRHYRTRATVCGTAERPRICIFCSNRHIYAQLIDDQAHRTLAAVTSVTKETKVAPYKNCCNRPTAERLGRDLGQKMKSLGIARAVFDRGGYLYHGVVKTFADAVRAVDEKDHFLF
jgi:large subunit ribosomal protein L18